MNGLTALRSYGKPGCCPAKGVRIFNDCFYVVRFQNVETDSNPYYVGLAEGEYTELLPGFDARAARDRQLNHCNGITKWDGPVWRVEGFRVKKLSYAASLSELQPLLAALEQERLETVSRFRSWIAELEAEPASPHREKLLAIYRARLAYAEKWSPSAVKVQ